MISDVNHGNVARSSDFVRKKTVALLFSDGSLPVICIPLLKLTSKLECEISASEVSS